MNESFSCEGTSAPRPAGVWEVQVGEQAEQMAKRYELTMSPVLVDDVKKEGE